MAARVEVIQLNLYKVVVQMVKLDQRSVIHLDGHVGADAELRVPADGPVLDSQGELYFRRVGDAVGFRGQQSQLRTSIAEFSFDLLNCAWGSDFLQESSAGGDDPQFVCRFMASAHPAW